MKKTLLEIYFKVIKWLGVSVFRAIYTFSLDFYYWAKYHWKFEKVAEAVSCKKNCYRLAVLSKRNPGAVVFLSFLLSFLEHLLFLKLFYSSLFPIGQFSPSWPYLLKDNRYTRKSIEICSKLTLKIPKQRYWCCSDVFIVNFGHTSYVSF